MAIEPTPQFVRIELAHDLPGIVAGVLQPSVMFVLRVESELPPDLSTRLGRAFPRPPGQSSAGDAPAQHRLAERIGSIAVELLKHQGLPIFSPAVVARLDATALRLVVPTVPGVHALTRQLVAEVVKAVDAALATDPAQAPGEPLRAVLQLIRRQAPSGKNTLPMLVTANRLGIPWDRVHGNVYSLGQGAKARWFDSSLSDRTPGISVQLAQQKHAAAAVLRRHWLPVPRHQLVRSEDEALAAAAKIGFPVVVKPANLDRGIGVAAGLRDADSVARAYRAAVRHSQLILVEKHAEGRDHRIHVFEGEVFRVRHRIPGGVTGDGNSTVEQLLQALNADPRRGAPGSHAELIRIDLDQEALDLLRERRLEPAQVPAAGEFVQLRRIANVSVGGVSLPVAIDDVHPDNLALATRAVAALKLDLAAVDLLIPDIRRSWLEVGAAICEVNARPQFGADAPQWLFNRIFAGQGRITVVAVVGDCRPGGWTDRLRARVQAAGTRLGFSAASGTWIGHERVPSAQATDVFQGCRFLVGDERIDAILIGADRSLLAHGLPTDRYDALVVTDPGAMPVAEYTQLAYRISRHSTRVIFETGADGWRTLRDRMHCDDCTEATADAVVERLATLLTEPAMPGARRPAP